MGEAKNCALSLTNVTKSYAGARALANLSFSVAEGRFFVLFGPSSVGKTTTLRTIAGLVTPDRGRVAPFIGNVVGHPGKGVDGGDVRPHRGRQQPRRHRKVLVVRLCEGLASGVRGGERSARGND